MKKILQLTAIAIIFIASSISLISGITKDDRYGGDKDLVDPLYFQEVKRNSSLNEIEELKEDIIKKKTETLEKYNRFVNFQNRYYNDAQSATNSIQELTIQQKAKDLLKKSEVNCKSTLVEWNANIAALEANEKEFNDLHKLLKISITIPIIQNLQNTEMPDNTDINSLNKEVLKIISKIKAINQ